MYASAAPVTWYLQGVTFVDGGTATGSFVYDANTNTYSSINITTTSGATLQGFTYAFYDPTFSDATIVDFVTSNNPNKTGTSYLELDFTPPLTNAGGTIPLNNASVEFTCINAACNPPGAGPSRVLASGSVTTTPGVAVTDAYQLHYLANLNIGDGVINITNAGTLGADAFGPQAGATGRICVNVYAFTPDEQEMACCSCLITPNALVHLSARTDLLPNTLNLSTPNSIVVKLLATIPLSSTGTGGTNTGPFTGSTCNAASPFDTTNLAPGLRAWATTLHALPTSPVTYGVTESRFQPAVLSPGELNKLTTLCRFIVGNGSGAGICKSCSLGGLGADKQ